MKNELIKFLAEVAEGRTYESEYDGRVDEYCAFCNCGGGMGGVSNDPKGHDDDCLRFRAQTLLAELEKAK